MNQKYFFKNTGVIIAGGKDLTDFLNRMSTNDLRNFRDGEYKKTVLTTDKGKIVDLIGIINLSNLKILITSFDNQERVISHLNKYIIADDVTLEKPADEYLEMIVFTDNPEAVSSEILKTEITKNTAAETEDKEYIFTDDFRLTVLNILIKKKDKDRLREKFKNYTELSIPDYEKIRIDAGIPEGRNELNEQINPLECGLGEYISYKKGCYIGQEVIARLDSQGKIPKVMVRINSDSRIEANSIISYEHEKEAGFISSVAQTDIDYHALGFIRNTELDFSKEYFTTFNNKKTKLKIFKIN